MIARPQAREHLEAEDADIGGHWRLVCSFALLPVTKQAEHVRKGQNRGFCGNIWVLTASIAREWFTAKLPAARRERSDGKATPRRSWPRGRRSTIGHGGCTERARQRRSGRQFRSIASPPLAGEQDSFWNNFVRHIVLC